MGFQITNDSHEVLFEEPGGGFQVEKLFTPLLIEETQQMKHTFGEATFREMYFDGYHIGVGNAQIHENLHISSTDIMDTVSLIFMVHGQFDTISHNTGKRRFSSLEHNLLYDPMQSESADVFKQA